MAGIKVGTNCLMCNKPLRVDPQLIGKKVRCPACRKTFVLSKISFSEPAQSSSAGQAVEITETQMNSAQSAETFGAAPPGAIPKPPATATIGRFRLHEALGQGGFGVVYRADDPLLERQVALKVPLFSDTDGKRTQRFLNEARAAARLRHPNIVAVFESGRVDGKLFLAAEYVQGQTLAERLKASRPSIEQAVVWVRELAGALEYAHARGIVHRDIKPHNVMIDGHDRPQIMDFGLAKRLDQDSTMTSEGALLGTPAYMSPEQARGDTDNVGPASDQYSLGVVLYELLTGKRPFDGPPAAVIAKAISTDPPAPCQINPDVPRDLEAICQKAMEKNSARRYSTLAAFATDLANWQQGEITLARPIGTIERSRRWVRRSPAVARLVLTVAALLILAAAGSGAGAFLSNRSTRQREAALASAREETSKAAQETRNAEQTARRALEETTNARDETQRAQLALRAHEAALSRLQAAQLDRFTKEEELAGVTKARQTAAQDSMEAARNSKSATEAQNSKTDTPNPEASATVADDAPPANLSDSAGIQLVLVPAGNFRMGSPPTETGRSRNEDQVDVELTKAFYLGKTEVTQGQWVAIMGSKPWTGQSLTRQGDTYPAIEVSWDEAIAFCRKLAEKEGSVYRLPTEAEWEYACRAGSTTRFSFGEDETQFGLFAWHQGNTLNIDERYPHAVGLKAPNSFGLCDMHGNVAEWCQDVDVDNLPGGLDPLSAAGSSSRVTRGGGWRQDLALCRSACRLGHLPQSRSVNLGFRVVRELPGGVRLP